MGIENLYGGYFLPRIPGCMSAKVSWLVGTGKGQSAARLLKKTDPADSADLYPATLLFRIRYFAVFLAEPISDIVAAAITTITFMSRFNGILNRGKV